MGSVHETNRSLWIVTTPDDQVPASVALGEPVDVAIVGAGICGLSLARLVAASGASVVVLDAGSLAAGATGNTTAKISALQGSSLSELRDRVGSERTAVYATANLAAVDQVARFVVDDAIDCGFERAAACTYATDARGTEVVTREHDAAQEAGLSTRLGSAPELAFPTTAAVWLDDQAQFHPRRYCLGLADAIGRAGGRVLSHIRVLGVDERREGCVLSTAHGDLHAERVVLATHLPFPDSGGFFARAHPYRSYAIAARIAGPRLAGMYINAGERTRSLRSTPDGWTIVGGEGHKVGHDDDTRDRYRALEEWTHTNLGDAEIGHRWSAQDYLSVDGVPYVGRLTAHHDRVYVATGFRKWGMTNGTAAAMLLHDLLSGRAHPWAETFDATRLAPGASIASLVAENVEVGKRLVGDRIRTIHPPPAADLPAGGGGICRLDGQTVAAYRDDDGALHAVAANCSHLGCRLMFNTAERSFDCPCHGSRFDVDGHVLEGPAVEDLAPAGNRPKSPQPDRP
ncbi:MAG: FAD-dependent oxidoreductase [Actinobacteria bacterium]|nr:FAD-dependent oxidoreductase [Actinomycetota bacterium]